MTNNLFFLLLLVVSLIFILNLISTYTIFPIICICDIPYPTSIHKIIFDTREVDEFKGRGKKNFFLEDQTSYEEGILNFNLFTPLL